MAHINAFKDEDIVMASHFLDWAYIAAPDEIRVLELVLEVYKMRIECKQRKTQEMLVCLDHMSEFKAKVK